MYRDRVIRDEVDLEIIAVPTPMRRSARPITRGRIAVHICMICFVDSGNHPAECYQDECGEDGQHFPPLCCPGCPCRSFEEAHEVKPRESDLG